MTCVSLVTVYPGSINLKVGTWYYDATVEISPIDADCKSVSWYSDNPNVATVNSSNGYIYANSVGTANIFAVATDGSGRKGCICVTVSNTVPITSVVLNKGSLSLGKNNSTTLTATVYPSNATNKILNWNSSNPSIASVNSNGEVCAHCSGSAVITATATDGSNVCDCCTVTVTEDVLVTSIELDQTSIMLIEGESIYLHATVCPEDATNKCVQWCSSNPDVATVNPESGLVYAKRIGKATITAMAKDGSATWGICAVGVEAQIYVENITVTSQAVTLEGGETIKLEATICPSEATETTLHWCSEHPDIAEVDNDGNVFAKKVGTTIIYATATDGSGVYGCSNVMVLSDLIPVECITLMPQAVTPAGGDRFNLTATICPPNATIQELNWHSEAPDIAEVDEKGTVLAKKQGTAIIWATAKDHSGVCGRSNVMVLSDLIPAESITVSTETLELNVDETATLTATVSPETATIQSVKWVSADPSIAEVDEVTGVVTAKASGVTMIYAQAMDGSGIMGSCFVMVIAYTYPTDKRKLSQKYKSSHKGIDVADNEGKPIYAFADGIVAYKGEFNGNWHPNDPNPPYSDNSRQTMGNYIVVNHYNPDKSKSSGEYARTIYMHLRDVALPNQGDTVKTGEIIGYMGNTGRSSGNHLHFALAVGDLESMKPGSTKRVLINNLPMIDPCQFLPEYY